MNKDLLIVCAAAIPLALGADPFPGAPPIPQEPLTQPVSSTNLKSNRATEMIGAQVSGHGGQNIGTLADIVFDMRDGRVAFGVIKTSEDDRKIAAPAPLLTAHPLANTVDLNCDEQRFRAAADFAKSDLLDPLWATTDYAYFQQKEPATQLAAGSIIDEAAGAELPGKDANVSNSTLVRSTDLVGGAVQDRDGKPLGEIKDAVIDWTSKRMLYAVLDTSETTGLGNRYRYVAVSPGALSQTVNGGSFVVNTTKENLAAAPSFDQAMWPAASDSDFTAKVNAFYSR